MIPFLKIFEFVKVVKQADKYAKICILMAPSVLCTYLGLALKIEFVQIIMQFFQLKAIRRLFKNLTCGIKRRPSW